MGYASPWESATTPSHSKILYHRRTAFGERLASHAVSKTGLARVLLSLESVVFHPSSLKGCLCDHANLNGEATNPKYSILSEISRLHANDPSNLVAGTLPAYDEFLVVRNLKIQSYRLAISYRDKLLRKLTISADMIKHCKS
jgi:hypothetical protein